MEPPAAPQSPPLSMQVPQAEPVRVSPEDLALVRRSLGVLSRRSDRATGEFYALLFVRHPEVRELFPAAMDVQRDRLFRALLTGSGALAGSAGERARVRAWLRGLGRDHRKYGALAEHYGPVGECLIEAVRRYCGMPWDAALDGAWRRVYGALAAEMTAGAAADALVAPAWWMGEIVSVERRTGSVAVLTVRPDQPYPFRAGQYATLETPWWPRVWRHYSFASAPRPDGTLSFHVKAVPAGWVSGALVHRAGPGDLIRLGPPQGGMTVDHGSDRGLLCLGGGTGIAPIKAIVEEVAQHSEAVAGTRRVEVFYGARRPEELYVLDALEELARRHRGVSVRPVIGDPVGDAVGGPVVDAVAGPAGNPFGDAGTEPPRGLGLSGALPDVVRRFGPWETFDGYLSGPPAMVRRGVTALLGSGMPADRIRHDLAASGAE
ncbi:globin domain-containing protein [Phaeacidiphilus oryzae]|uniref:globin domain-containing protein n=1 Tax=Phaeacidiphilus oryzae TaxID=348818 RepID=UPI001F2499EB|nr:globin domain-containing protein [Phaeacidiphilus oryzae]